MQRHVTTHGLEEAHAVTDDDGHHGVANLVDQPQSQTLATERSATDDPDVAEAGLHLLVQQPTEVARPELDGVVGFGQVTTRGHEDRLVSVRPACAKRSAVSNVRAPMT